MTLLDNSSLILTLVVLISACFGSFITLISHRLPLDEPIVATRSKCPSCNTSLGVRDLFPVFSYLFSGGKCRHCKTRISPRYVMTELASIGVAVGLFALYGATWQFLLLALLGFCLIALIITDLEHFLILDEFQIVMLLLGAAYAWVIERPLPNVLIGLAVGLTIGLTLRYGFLWIRKKQGLGLGDVKFLAVAGLWLGVQPLVPFLFFSGVLGVMSALIWQILGRGERFPFGPSLAVSLFVCLVFPAVPAAFWDISDWLQ